MITADRQSLKGVAVGRRATQEHQVSWALLPWWLLATTSAVVPIMLQDAYWLSPQMRDLEQGPWELLVSLAFSALTGLTFGVLQSILLAKEHLKAFPWIVTSTCAWVAVWVVGMIMDKLGLLTLYWDASPAYRLLMGLVFALIVGVVVGLVQGLGMVPSRSWSWVGWWALATTFGLVLAELAISPALMISDLARSLATTVLGMGEASSYLHAYVLEAIRYAILGLVCGMSLVWLLLLDPRVHDDTADQMLWPRLRIHILPVRDNTLVVSGPAAGSRPHPTRVRRVPVELLHPENAPRLGGFWLKRTEFAIVGAMGLLAILPIVVARTIPWLLAWSTSYTTR